MSGETEIRREHADQAGQRDDPQGEEPGGAVSAGGAVRAIKRVASQSMRDDVMGLGAELSYRFFLALFPFFIFLTALGATIASRLAVQNPAEQVVQMLGDTLPEQAASIVEGQLQAIIEGGGSGLLSLGAILALVFATGGMNAIIKALNRVYSVEENRPFWKRYLMALALTIVAGLALVGAFLLIGPLRAFGPQIAEMLGLGDFAPLLMTIVGGVLAFVLVALAAAYVYRIAPNIELPVRSVLPGALLFALGWAVGTIGFFFYVTNFGNYANTYGALAGVVIVLIWFYLSSLIFLISGEVNEVLHEMRAPADVESRRRQSKEREQRADESQRQRREAPAERRRRAEEADEEGAASA